MLTTSNILNLCDIGIIIVDQDRHILQWNSWLTNYTGIKEDDAIDKTLEEVFQCTISKHLNDAIDDALLNGRSTLLSPRLHKHPLPLFRESREIKGKEPVHQKIVISSFKGKKEERRCIINISDVTASILREIALQKKTIALKKTSDELIQSAKEITKLAFHDSLTGLANRTLFNDRLDMAMVQAKRQNEMMGIMLIDIDNFKQVNDTYGHAVGDELLVATSRRIEQCIRESDTAARLGGDEFTVIQTQLDHIGGATTLANKLTKVISEPITINNHVIKTSPSIGVSIFPNDANTSDDLLKNADMAMYNIKQNGRAGWQFYSNAMRSAQDQREKQYTNLLNAINNNRIVVHYQPEIHLSENKIDSFEALVRYVDDDDKLVMPDDFISIAEESGLINQITDIVLENICNASMLWKDINVPSIAINLSTIQFHNNEIIEKLNTTHNFLKKQNSKLEIELTESILMENMKYAVNTLDEISKSGISIALDDFGTGYSSLEYLRSFPLKKLKIDRSFISGIADKNNDAMITDTIISLGHNLGMKVVAEGVESQFQHNYLVKQKCDVGQGFHYSMPISKKDLSAFTNSMQVA